MGIWDLFLLGVKRPGREADHLLQSCADVRNKYRYASSVLLLIMYSFIPYTGIASGIQSRTELRCVESNAVPTL